MIPAADIRRIEHRGAVLRLRKELEAIKEPVGDVLEYLVEGPRGTGKSNGVAYLLWKLCRGHKNVRVLVIRSARSLLTDTFCKTYEEDVCPGHRSISQVQRTQRHEYVFPASGSRIVLGGLDEAIRYHGSDWDIIAIEEAIEETWKEVEPFLGSLRNHKLPFHALIYLTNPDAPKHWLNQRANQGLCKRMVCRHRDNPSLFDVVEGQAVPTEHGAGFLKQLHRYTGTAYRRHALGEWAGAEGMVWENFSEGTHVIEPTRKEDQTIDYSVLGVKDFIGSMDWGFTAPGSLSVWGRDGDKRLVRVAGVYQTKQQLEWWAERVCELDTEFGLTRIKCDPSRPDAIALVNDWLSKRGKPRLCEPADNKRSSSVGGDLAGIDLVRWGFEKDETGVPRIRFLRGALRWGIDAELHAANQPTQGWDEISGYVFARDSAGEILDDRTDPDVPDHFCDELRYVCAENWNRSAPAPDPIPKFDAGSMGSVYRHADEFKAKRRHRPAWRMGV